MLKQFSKSAISRAMLVAGASLAIASCIGACGVKGPLVPAPKEQTTAETPAPTPATPAPLIKDPAQPERRP